jgi:ribosome-associated translation inhibitor RaiA
MPTENPEDADEAVIASKAENAGNYDSIEKALNEIEKKVKP